MHNPNPEAGVRQLLQLLTYFDWLALPRTVMQSLAHADRGQPRGAPGRLQQAGAGLAGASAWPFFVPQDGPWGAPDIQALLASKGVKLWGLGFANGEMFFQVSRRQAAWAQYIMQRAGVPLLHGTLAETPAGHADQAGADGAASKRQDGLERLLNTLERWLP